MYQSTSKLLEKYARKRPRDEIKHTDWNYVISVLSQQIDKVQLTASSTKIPLRLVVDGEDVTNQAVMVVDANSHESTNSHFISTHMNNFTNTYKNELPPYNNTTNNTIIYFNELSPYNNTTNNTYKNELAPYRK